MLRFTKPADHDRFNATLYELCYMNFQGGVVIDGSWDADTALQYMERRSKLRVIPTLNADGSVFKFRNKGVVFERDRVVLVARH